jgi:hypothetical protein
MPTPKINQHRAPVGTFMHIEENVSVNDNVKVNSDIKVDNEVDKNVSTDHDVYVYVKKKKFEDLHTRQTVYIENELAKKIDKIAGKERGLKTRIINDALREFLTKIKI